MPKLESPKVTVALLTYNRSAYLSQSIRGILSQTFTNFKLVIIDNASTDETVQIVSKFHDPRIVYIRHSENIGGLANHNFAIDFVSTPYFIIAHDDDEMMPELLNHEVSVLDSDGSINLVSANMVSIDSNGSQSESPFYNLTKNICYDRLKFIYDYCRGRNFIGCPTVMLRTEIIKRENLHFRPEVGPAADTALWFDVNLLPGKMVVLKEVLYRYRIHSDQDSLTNEVFLYCKLYEYIKRFLILHSLSWNTEMLRASFSKILVPRLRKRLLSGKQSLDRYLSDKNLMQQSQLWSDKGWFIFATRLFIRRPVIAFRLVTSRIYGD